MSLSVQQRHILQWLLTQACQAEKERPDLLEIGSIWALKCNNKADENSLRASYSRTLARLERRGLVIRIKGHKKTRTVRVALTAEGRRAAEALSNY